MALHKKSPFQKMAREAKSEVRGALNVVLIARFGQGSGMEGLSGVVERFSQPEDLTACRYCIISRLLKLLG